jgi:hypothetical protein
VDHIAVVAGLMTRYGGLFFNDYHAGVRALSQYLQRCAQPYGAAADNNNIVLHESKILREAKDYIF